MTALQGILLARLLGPRARGEYGTVVFFTQTLTYVGLLGTQFAVARRASREPSCRFQLARSAIRLGALTGIGTIFVVAALAFTTLPPAKQALAPLCVLCALVLPVQQILLLLLAVDQGSGAFRRYSLIHIVTTAVLPVLLLVMFLVGELSAMTAALLTVVGPVVGLVLRLTLGGRPSHSSAGHPPVMKLVKEGKPYLFSMAISDLYERLDAFLMLWLGSFTGQGFYAAALPAASTLQVGTSALALFSFNAASRSGAPSSLKRLVHAGMIVAGIQLLQAFLLALIIGPLITLAYGSRFSGALPLAFALLPGHAMNGFAQVAEGHLRGRGKVRIGIRARLVAAVVMVTTVLMTFGWLRELSIPIATSLAHGLVAVTLAWFVVVDVRTQASAPVLLATEESD